MVPRIAARLVSLLVLAGIGLQPGGAAGGASPTRAPAGPQILTADVDRFYRLYDAADGHPDASALQRGYIDPGTSGLHEFIPDRIKSAGALAAKIAAEPQVYVHARQCAAALAPARRRLRKVFARLAALYPAAIFPPVTVLIGRDNSAGTTGRSGVLIGLETVCRADQLQPDLTDRLVHIIAHEYVHVEQDAAGALPDGEHPTVLKAALAEGGAEFIDELISGEASESYIAGWVRGREAQIGREFLAQATSTDLHDWFYTGVGTREHPGDLGYWIGSRIARSFYLHASDKRAAIRELIALKDPQQILKDSGWRPGD